MIGGFTRYVKWKTAFDKNNSESFPFDPQETINDLVCNEAT